MNYNIDNVKLIKTGKDTYKIKYAVPSVVALSDRCVLFDKFTITLVLNYSDSFKSYISTNYNNGGITAQKDRISGKYKTVHSNISMIEKEIIIDNIKCYIPIVILFQEIISPTLIRKIKIVQMLEE